MATVDNTSSSTTTPITRKSRWSLSGMTALVTGGTRGIGHKYQPTYCRQDEKDVLTLIDRAKDKTLPQAYTCLGSGIIYRSESRKIKYFDVASKCVPENAKLMLKLETDLGVKQVKSNDDKEMITFLVEKNKKFSKFVDYKRMTSRREMTKNQRKINIPSQVIHLEAGGQVMRRREKPKLLKKSQGKLTLISGQPLSPLNEDTSCYEDYLDQMFADQIVKVEATIHGMSYTRHDGSTKEFNIEVFDQHFNLEMLRILSLIPSNMSILIAMKMYLGKMLIDREEREAILEREEEDEQSRKMEIEKVI
ncbi:hypothetical protein POM88_040332 [Heracleum sosnowskyi]|uniref:Uncharacterized protein n=1 Tax=Heracleum sosnowskyi TaxID=360622 RepID=A0AAD8M8M8_9APIA|nr:hypothetical protein POM88_040332 [Heracleum sosnowskyi]